MSLAGVRSSRGDEYQLRIATYWVIQLLTDNELEGVQAESLGVPGDQAPPMVDDVVVLRKDGTRIYIQAKKNQKDFKAWSLQDSILKDELVKAREQLESDPKGKARFYSQSPFGELEKLAEACISYPDYKTFSADATITLTDPLNSLSVIIDRSLSDCFELCKRIEFGPYHRYEDWDRVNADALLLLYTKPIVVRTLLERLIGSNLARLRDPKIILTKDSIISELEKAGHFSAPARPLADTIEAFKKASSIGRQWIRDIGGITIQRKELSETINAVEQGAKRILIVDQPGSGKTCLLLDLVDHLESEPGWACLFIKGDQFSDAKSEEDLMNRGLPEDIVGQCSRLAMSRHVVVVVDSLDVLSIHRNSGALKLFIGVLDRLARIENVVTIAACRQFDLQYDPHLRARTWDVTIPLSKLDFKEVVSPLLASWGFELQQLSTELQDILCIPQYLRLFRSVAQSEQMSTVATVMQLYDRFFDEVVRRDPMLGDHAMQVLLALAEQLHNTRSQRLPREAFIISEELLQRLVSQQVLFDAGGGMLSFSHQEMMDYLMVRSIVASGQKLIAFIKSRVALPYLRPTVRMFFFYLRVVDREQFRRQAWAVLNDQSIAYHIRRLIAESLAEIDPSDDDYPLLLRLLREHPGLFDRFLESTRKLVWLPLIVDYLLPEVLRRDDSLVRVQRILGHIGKWAEDSPGYVLRVWARALQGNWPGSDEVLWYIEPALSKLAAIQIEGVREVLELLLGRLERVERRWVGQLLQVWIEKGSDGDDLLWRLLGPIELPTSSTYVSLEDRNESIHDFGIEEDFLQDRLCRSELFLTCALDYLLDSYSDQRDRWSHLIYDTSWRLSNLSGLHGHDFKNCIIDGVEKGLREHAVLNDSWWGSNEPMLRNHSNMGVRYLLMRAYLAAPVTNIPGIIAQLTDPKLRDYSLLADFLGNFINAVYPFLPEEDRDAYQNAVILALSADDVDDNIVRTVYCSLVWIPCIFRSESCREFIEKWKPRFGFDRPRQLPSSWSGFVGSPVSADTLMTLSENGLVRLIQYFKLIGNIDRWWNENAGQDVSMFPSEISRAVARDPETFIRVFDRIKCEDPWDKCLNAIISGVATHLRYRFGNLSSDKEWRPVEPLPDGVWLTKWLLRSIELYESTWLDKHVKREAVNACTAALCDYESACRLTFILLRMQCDEDPSGLRDNSPESVALNSVRGVAASSALLLYSRLIEAEIEPPELLLEVLRRYASDPVPGVRYAIVHSLPYLIYKRPEIGWALFDLCLTTNTSSLWAGAERVLYHCYNDDYAKIVPYLDCLRRDSRAEGGEVYGRIAMLSVLAGHLSLDDLFSSIEIDEESIWIGIAQVLSANVGSSVHASLCETGLQKLFSLSNVSSKVMQAIRVDPNDEDEIRHLSAETMVAYVRTATTSDDPWHRSHQIAKWLSVESVRDPLGALIVLEELAVYIQKHQTKGRLFSGGELVSALNATLREADERDDAALIQRVIDLQDKFLQVGVTEVDAMLDAASRP